MIQGLLFPSPPRTILEDRGEEGSAEGEVTGEVDFNSIEKQRLLFNAARKNDTSGMEELPDIEDCGGTGTRKPGRIFPGSVKRTAPI